MKKNLFILFAFLLAGVSLMAQPISVKGKVTDQEGLPIPGVSVLKKGTTDGTITNLEGIYQILVSANETLVFSFIGMKTQEVTVGTDAEINVVLKNDVIGLDEVVAIGYGTASKKDLTGSVASVKMENSPIAALPTINVMQALQGKAPGVNIGATTSAGESPGINIRGQNSISASNYPLIVLDGVIFDGNLSEISSDDIATFNILKDASSAAIYGSRAANGVILITTKRGKSEKPVINLNTYVGFNDWTRMPDMMEGEEFIEWRRYIYSIYGQEDLSLEAILEPKELKAYNEGHQTNWLEEIQQKGIVQNYQMSVSGASDKANYYISGSYMDQQGVLDGDNFTRFSLTSKLDGKITSWLSYGFNGYYNQRDYSGESPDIYIATWYTPYSYKWHDEENHILDKYPTSSLLYNPYTNYYNSSMDKRWGVRGTGYIKADIPFVKGLSYKLSLTGNQRVVQRGYFAHEMSYVNTDKPEEVANPSVHLNKTNGWKEDGIYRTWVADNLLTYKKTFGSDHSVDALVGYTRDYYMYDNVRFSASDFQDAGTTVLGFNGLKLGNSEKRGGKTDVVEYSNVGYIARLNYAYKGKYLLTGTFRRDGYSAFAKDHKFGNFPGASVAWVASEEGFMQGLKPLVNYLKLRFSYGKNGNQAINPYLTKANVNVGTTYLDDGPFLYSYPASLVNEKLTWETTTAFNVGIDFSILNERLSGDINFYKSQTTDQLMKRKLPVISGYSEVWTNIGQVDNKGLEISLNSVNIQSGGFKWESGVNFWLNRNKLVSIYGEDLDGDGVEDDDIGNRWFIGESLGAIYDYTIDGVVQTEDTEYLETYGGEPGDLKYVDINTYDEETGEIIEGVPDGKITSADRSIIGYRNPKFRANISNTITYKNLQLYFDFNLAIGGGKKNYYMKENKRAFEPFFPWISPWLSGREYWTPEKQSNIVPRPNYQNSRGYGYYQSRSFCRLQNVTLSYNLPKSMVDKVGLRGLKVFASGKNLGVITDWIGLDPESGSAFGGNDKPVTRTISFGANVSF